MPAPDDRPQFALRLEPDDPAPAYLQLERQVRIAVADGVLRPGDRLLSVRAAAASLGLASNTVGRVYADLAREGILVTRPNIRGGEQIVEVRFRVRDNSEIVAVVTRASLERLRLQTGKPLLAHIKATEITLGR